MEAVFRNDPRNLKPDASHLASKGHKLLTTRYGPLDLLGTIETNTDFDALYPDSEWFLIAELRVRIIKLERLITVKSQLTRPKDRLMLLLLEATLSERNLRSDDSSSPLDP